jgi:hypothetical protein
VGLSHFSPNGLRLVHIVHSYILFSSACSLSLQVCDFIMSCNLFVFPLYIEGVINAVKLLGEVSLATIYAINLYEYVPFNFHKCRQSVPFSPNHHFSLFQIVGTFSMVLKFFSVPHIFAVNFTLCVVCRPYDACGNFYSHRVEATSTAHCISQYICIFYLL